MTEHFFDHNRLDVYRLSIEYDILFETDFLDLRLMTLGTPVHGEPVERYGGRE